VTRRDLTTQEGPSGSDLVAVSSDVERFPTGREISLPKAAASYIMFKRKRLTAKSEIGYRAVLDELTKNHPGATLADFEPPNGSILIEDFLAARWGNLAPRTYNKSFSVLSDFFGWHVDRGTLNRDPMATIEKAKARPVRRVTFTDDECARILAANPQPRDQIALRLLLFYGIRKGALCSIRFCDFDPETRRLVVFTKGEKYHVLPIVEEDIWQLLAQINEPGDHYLLPRQRNRMRKSHDRHLFEHASDLLGELQETAEAITDPACSRELAQLLERVDLAFGGLSLVVAAASMRTTADPSKPIGSHSAHLWWYRCLTKAGVVGRGQTSGRKMHGARHTAIQRVLDKTGNLKAAQAVAGHATIGTTADVYTDWTASQTEETMRKVLG
jgi:integrase